MNKAEGDANSPPGAHIRAQPQTPTAAPIFQKFWRQAEREHMQQLAISAGLAILFSTVVTYGLWRVMRADRRNTCGCSHHRAYHSPEGGCKRVVWVKSKPVATAGSCECQQYVEYYSTPTRRG